MAQSKGWWDLEWLSPKGWCDPWTAQSKSWCDLGWLSQKVDVTLNGSAQSKGWCDLEWLSQKVDVTLNGSVKRSMWPWMAQLSQKVDVTLNGSVKRSMWPWMAQVNVTSCWFLVCWSNRSLENRNDRLVSWIAFLEWSAWWTRGLHIRILMLMMTAFINLTVYWLQMTSHACMWTLLEGTCVCDCSVVHRCNSVSFGCPWFPRNIGGLFYWWVLVSSFSWVSSSKSVLFTRLAATHTRRQHASWHCHAAILKGHRWATLRSWLAHKLLYFPDN